MNSIDYNDAEFITPPNRLKQKVGSGGLPAEVLQKADALIANNNFDFRPLGLEYLEAIEATLERSLKSRFRTHDHVIALTNPVMLLKAHGGMFGYPLVSEISYTALRFLENIHVLDDDAIEIVQAHYDILESLFENNIRGLGGDEGYKLVTELANACNRYYRKHNIFPDY